MVLPGAAMLPFALLPVPAGVAPVVCASPVGCHREKCFLWSFSMLDSSLVCHLPIFNSLFIQ